MSEETVVQQEEQLPVEATKSAEIQPEVDPYEAQAREQGWKPKEEYTDDPSKWRTAKEFVERGELFSKIDSMGKELKETRKALQMLQTHHAKVKETEFQNALQELKKLQKQHLEDGNTDGFIETSEMITGLKAEQAARAVATETQARKPDPNFAAWISENTWYNTNTEMQEFADTVATGYAKRNPGDSPQDVLDYVTKQVKLHFKEKFVNPNRTKPSAVESVSTPAKTNTIELTEEERKTMNTFLRMGVMSKEEYLAEVKKMRG